MNQVEKKRINNNNNNKRVTCRQHNDMYTRALIKKIKESKTHTHNFLSITITYECGVLKQYDFLLLFVVVFINIKKT